MEAELANLQNSNRPALVEFREMIEYYDHTFLIERSNTI